MRAFHRKTGNKLCRDAQAFGRLRVVIVTIFSRHDMINKNECTVIPAGAVICFILYSVLCAQVRRISKLFQILNLEKAVFKKHLI